LGLARLLKVTVIAPRSEYADVAKSLAQFRDFHPVEDAVQNFDPQVQELTVKAVRLFSQADQAAKDLGLQLTPGWMDMVFRGVKIEKSSFEAAQWDELLGRAEAELEPITQEIKVHKTALQKVTKEETDAQTLRDALQVVSGFSANLAGLSDMKRFRAVVCIVKNEVVSEFRNSLPDPIFLVQPLNQTDSLVLAVVRAVDASKLDKTVKALEIKPLAIPSSLPQNPTKAYDQLTKDYEGAKRKRLEIEEKMEEVRARTGSKLLGIRELTEAAREMLDEARVSGEMKRLATISGYIPAREEEEFKQLFGRWMAYAEPVGHTEKDKQVPVLMENRRGIRLWQLITAEQGIPSEEEVDPTPLSPSCSPRSLGLCSETSATGSSSRCSYSS
jgi:vacuolar-type H+-ATPase subunit I/STV1